MMRYNSILMINVFKTLCLLTLEANPAHSLLSKILNIRKNRLKGQCIRSKSKLIDEKEILLNIVLI